MTDRLDITRRGRRDYTEAEADAVAAYMLAYCVGAAAAQTAADIASRLGMDGRTVRQIVSDLDGVAFLVGGGDEGWFVAEYAEDAEGMTRRLQATAAALSARVERRAAFDIARRQASLW